MLKWPVDPLLETRIIQVPAELHRTLKHAEALPLFQMIAKNVGIRRAHGILLDDAIIDMERVCITHGQCVNNDLDSMLG